LILHIFFFPRLYILIFFFRFLLFFFNFNFFFSLSIFFFLLLLLLLLLFIHPPILTPSVGQSLKKHGGSPMHHDAGELSLPPVTRWGLEETVWRDPCVSLNLYEVWGIMAAAALENLAVDVTNPGSYILMIWCGRWLC
jgi:hypothetical protein